MTLPLAGAVADEAGEALAPSLGPYSFVTFGGRPSRAFAVGAVCVAGDRVSVAIGALRDAGLEVVALNNRLSGTKPQLFSVHFQAKGEAREIAKAVRAAHEAAPAAPTAPLATSEEPDWSAIARLLGDAGATPKDGILKVLRPRLTPRLAIDEESLSPRMGVSSWVVFARNRTRPGTSVVGEVCALRSELQGCLDDLRHAGLAIEGIHSRLLGTSETLVFVQFRAQGDALALAKGIGASFQRLADRPR